MFNRKQIIKTVFLLTAFSALFLGSCKGAEVKSAVVSNEGSSLKVWDLGTPAQKQWISFKIFRQDSDSKAMTALNWVNIDPQSDKKFNEKRPFDAFQDVNSVESILAIAKAGVYNVEGHFYVVYNPLDSVDFFPMDSSISDEKEMLDDAEQRALSESTEYTVNISYSNVLSLSLTQMWRTTGLYGFLLGKHDLNIWANETYDQWSHDKEARDAHAYDAHESSTGGWGNAIMIGVGFLLIFLAIKMGFEPLLLVPIGIGAILANIPFVGIAGPEGFIGMLYNMGVQTGLFPLLIFMGVGAMTDFGPLIANPKTLLLGAAAQFGIFAALMGAVVLGAFYQPGGKPFFDLHDAAAIGIIGGADGPTAIFVARKLSPELLGAIAVAAYSYMALVPVIQPPFMKLLTTKKERMIKMEQLRHVTKREKIIFPLVTLAICLLLLPDATPLLGMLLFGNLAKESGVVDRLSDTMQNSLINIVTIFLGLSVGSKMSADKFLVPQTLGILALGVTAFIIGTCMGLLFAKVMNKFSKHPINPLIGSAGVSAVPMAARVANKVGQDNNPQNFLLMHAMGPNVAGVIGSAVAAGVLLNLVPFLAG